MRDRIENMTFQASRLQPAKAILICSIALVGLFLWQNHSHEPIVCPTVTTTPLPMPIDYPLPRMQLQAAVAEPSKRTHVPFSPGLLAPFVVSLEEGTTPT